MEFRLHANDTVRHFKGNLYTIMAMAIRDFNTGELGVAYVRNCDGTLWLRPYEMFLSEVDREKYPDVKQVYRMEKVETPSFEETTIAPYNLFCGDYEMATFFKKNGTDDIYILISNNYKHTETDETMALFVGLNDTVVSFMPYEDFKKSMTLHIVTEENISELNL